MRTVLVDNRKPQPVAPPPAPIPPTPDTNFGKYLEFARANPPKDALEKQRYLDLARRAQLKDNPIPPVQEDGETHASFVARYNEHFSRLGLAFRLNACPSGNAMPSQSR
jgi:hypothetical protein